MLEFCTPPVPGQRHEFYGNAHNNHIKLPVAIPHTTIQKTVSSNNTLHSIATSGNLALLKNILPFLPTPQAAVNEPHPATGLTPLHFASSRGHFNIVKYLVDDYSALVDAKDREGETALLKAAYNGHFHIVKYLVSKNANVHLKDKDGWTALHNACARGYLSITRLLIEHGARVDVKSKMGHTPLINAASKGYISIVEYLLTESHANPLIKNNFGEAAYDVSAAAGESYICEMLHKAGKLWWQMQHTTEALSAASSSYNLLDFHVTVMVVIHENQRSSSLLGLSKPQFSTASLTKGDVRGPWSLSPSGQQSTKEQVTLPLEKGKTVSDWFWLTDWQIDYSDPRIDPTSGWQYARSFDDQEEAWTPVTPTSGYGWVRRRIWVRVMKRRMDLLKGSHVGGSQIEEEEDYLCQAEDTVQNSKLEENPADAASDIQQLTLELRALEEAVQLLRAGVKNDGNQYRIHQANTLITSYTSQIDTLNAQIAQLAHTVSTPITPLPLQHNAELARELGFHNRNTASATDLDANPWSRDTMIASATTRNTPTAAAAAAAGDWQVETSSFNHVDLIGHGMEEETAGEPTTTEEERLPKQYVWESDTDVKECRGCRRKFGFLVRRHHCRCCGLIHCDRCSTSRAYLESSQILQDPNGPLESLEVLSSQHVRVCDNC